MYLIIAEKPAAAEKIGAALDARGIPTQKKIGKGKPFLEVTLFDSGDKAIIVSASGHLYELEKAKSKAGFPVFDFDWTINRKSKQAFQCLATISTVVKQQAFDRYIIATDYDTEGSVIGYNILRFACAKSKSQFQAVLAKARRMKFSALTVNELQQAWIKLEPSLDCPRVEAGYTRHLVDILFGLNLSAALTSAVKKAGKGFQVFSIGRVQGPTLKEVCERDDKILHHVPEEYWEIRASATIDGRQYSLDSVPATFKDDADALCIKTDCEGKPARVASVEAKKNAKKPPVPFNLAGLQREASHYFKFKPAKTLKIAEKLYLDALISYPRTDSEIIPPEIDIKALIGEIGKMHQYHVNAAEILARGNLVPSRGKKIDDAHPPILPTGLDPASVTLNKDDLHLLELITRRFLALFGPDLTWMEKNHEIIGNGHPFKLVTREILEPGWTRHYIYHDTRDLNDHLALKAGQELIIDEVNVEKKFTQPPPHHSEITLLNYMERVNIGTKSTRADIIEKLKDRKYIESDPIRATDLGNKIVDIFTRYLPTIVSVDMTRSLEDDMDAILQGKQKREIVVQRAIGTIRDLLTKFKAKEQDIGNDLGSLVTKQVDKRQVLGPCPACGQNSLVLVRTRGNRRFIACEGVAQKSCTVKLPISQAGKIYPTGKICPHCNYPMVKLYGKGKKPWIFCVNWASCPGTKRACNGTTP